MDSSHSNPARQPAHPRLGTRIGPWAWAVLLLLLGQNVLGTCLNLFVSLPASSDVLSLMAIFGVLAAHVIVGISLLVSTGVVLYLAGRTHRRSLWIPALAAFAFTFLAFESGIEFVIGGQDNLFSFLMEVFFLAAVASDVVLLHESARHAGRSETPLRASAAEE